MWRCTELALNALNALLHYVWTIILLLQANFTASRTLNNSLWLRVITMKDSVANSIKTNGREVHHSDEHLLRLMNHRRRRKRSNKYTFIVKRNHRKLGQVNQHCLLYASKSNEQNKKRKEAAAATANTSPSRENNRTDRPKIVNEQTVSQHSSSRLSNNCLQKRVRGLFILPLLIMCKHRDVFVQHANCLKCMSNDFY